MPQSASDTDTFYRDEENRSPKMIPQQEYAVRGAETRPFTVAASRRSTIVAAMLQEL